MLPGRRSAAKFAFAAARKTIDGLSHAYGDRKPQELVGAGRLQRLSGNRRRRRQRGASVKNRRRHAGHRRVVNTMTPSHDRITPLGSRNRLARLHADGRVPAADHRAGRRLHAGRYRRPRISRRHQQPVVQHPRPSPSEDRRGHARAARPSGPRDESGDVESHDDRAGQAAGRHRAAGTEARLLLRRRRHRRRSGAENGVAILAAAQRSAAGEDAVRGAGRRLSRRHDGRRQRRRRRALHRHVRAAVVRRDPRARAGYVSLAAGRDAAIGPVSIIWDSSSECWPSITSESPRW